MPAPLRIVTLAQTLALVTLAGLAIAADKSKIAVRSPDGKNELTLDVSPTEGVLYSVLRSGDVVISASPFHVTLIDKGDLADRATIVNVSQTSTDQTVQLPWGKASRIRDHYAAAAVRLKSSSGIVWDLELRAYDDGIAFRYGLPKQDGFNQFTVADQATEFRLSGDPSMLFMKCDSFTTSHEAPYQRKPLAELPAKTLFEVPLLADWHNKAAAILEGRLRDFAGMYLERATDSTSALRTKLSPLPSHKDAVVVAKTPHFSPWRVVLLADKAGRLIESNLPVLLNEPASGDFAWAKPGKTTWHWWNGNAEPGLPFRQGLNFETHKRYIDFCAKYHITYHAIVADERTWYMQSNPGYGPGPDTDILTPRPELELPKILDYAKEKSVGIRLWVHWKPLSNKLEEAFAKYESWGIKGLMVDFLDRNDQQMVEFNERVLESAAKHKLHIQFHGSYPPSGEQRTFPHLFNREGVLNLEYLKWSNLCAPDHNVNVAYTRLLAGPMDYHLGGFHSVSRRDFKPSNENPAVLGTRCHHLAMYVVYENAMPMVADSPSAYEGQTGIEFIAEVPTTWDETRFVAGEAGEYVVVARRKGDTWYLGGMTNWTHRKLELPLSFLGTEHYRGTFYVDGSLDEGRPNEVRVEHSDVSTASKPSIELAPGGGFVAILRAAE